MNKSTFDRIKDSKLLIAFAGFFGAITPTISQFIITLQEPTFEMPHPSFFLGGMLMGFLGLGLVLISKETVAWKSFTQGMSAPAFFSSAGTVAAVTVSSVFTPISVTNTAYAAAQLDSIQLTVIVTTNDTLNMTIDDKVYEICDTMRVKIPTLKSVRINKPGDDEFSKTFNIPQKRAVIAKVRVVQSRAGRHFLNGLLPLQQRFSKRFAGSTIQVTYE